MLTFLGQSESETPACPPCSTEGADCLAEAKMAQLPVSVAHPYRTGAGYIWSISLSIAWIIGTGMGINYLRKLKREANRRKSR